MLLRRLSRLFRVMIFISLSHHIFTLAQDYFQYATRSSYTSHLLRWNKGRDSDMPELTFCAPYIDIMNKTLLKQRFGDHAKIRDMESNLTIADIFKMTPDPDETLDRCFSRSTDALRAFIYKPSGCKRIFITERFYIFNQMCYSYRLHANYSFNIFTALQTITALETGIWAISMSDWLVESLNEVLLITHFGRPPMLSQPYAVKLRRDENNDYEGFKLRYHWIWNSLLPAPYDTMCHPHSGPCFDECYRSRRGILNKEFYTRFIDEPSNLSHLSLNDLMNETVRGVVSDTYKTCHQTCPHRPCEYSYTITYRDTSWPPDDPKSKRKLIFQIMSPESAGNSNQSFPKLDFYAFCIYVSNVIGFWLGLHCWSLVRIEKRTNRIIKRQFRSQKRRVRRRRVMQRIR